MDHGQAPEVSGQAPEVSSPAPLGVKKTKFLFKVLS